MTEIKAFLVESLKPPENPVNVRSSGEEMIQNMQSLLDVEDSINVSFFREIFLFEIFKLEPEIIEILLD